MQETYKLEFVNQKKMYDIEELNKLILQKAFARDLNTERMVAI